MPALVCYCACPDTETAERIAQALVEERLAACVNVLPGIHSIYRWNGAVERADETLLLVKTGHDRLDDLNARIRSLHPDELPELLAVEVAGGLPDYLHWVAEQTRTGVSNA